MTNFNLKTLLRPNLETMEPYTPILPFEVLSRQLGRKPTDLIKLDANENPYGASPLVAETLAKAPYLHIYPDPESRDLRDALADYTGMAAEYLLAGSGADELIDLIMRLVVEPGDVIINCPPTFGMYVFDGDINGATMVNVYRRADFSINIAEIKSKIENQKSKILFVTSPNNPDGSLLSDADLKELLTLPTLVVLDEAYFEFSGLPSRITWVKEYQNLIVLRTFSKWAGLAGLRVGYGAFPLEIMAHLWKIKQPYNVNVAGQLAAQVSLADRAYLLGNVAKIMETRDKFFAALQKITWLEAYPSHSNFILCHVKEGHQAVMVKQQLAQEGILVRYYNSPGLRDCLRFSIGTPEQMGQLIEGLKQFS